MTKKTKLILIINFIIMSIMTIILSIDKIYIKKIDVNEEKLYEY